MSFLILTEGVHADREKDRGITSIQGEGVWTEKDKETYTPLIFEDSPTPKEKTRGPLDQFLDYSSYP